MRGHNNYRLVYLLIVPAVFTAGFLFSKKSSKERIYFGKNFIEIISKELLVDRQYDSMEGPVALLNFTLPGKSKPELLWLTKYESFMVSGDGKHPVSQEYLCHSFFSVYKDRSEFNKSDGNLTANESNPIIDFPEGFGMPVLSNEKFMSNVQAVNKNPIKKPIVIRNRTRIHYIPQEELKKPFKPLTDHVLSVYKARESMADISNKDIVFMEDEKGMWLAKAGDISPSPDNILHLSNDKLLSPRDQPQCHITKEAHDGNSGDIKPVTGHWFVKPGREEVHSNVTKFMDLHFDTTIHFITMHLHAFAESMELRDLTTGESLVKLHAKNYAGKVGLEKIEQFSSAEGIKVYKDHEYELVSVYNNTTDHDISAMAMMVVYLLDKGSPYYQDEKNVAMIGE